MKHSLDTSLALRWKMDVLRRGEVVATTPFRQHMITDAGLDMIGNSITPLVSHIISPYLGYAASPTPVRRDSGATTVSQSGNVITASGNFFEAADVGRLLKFGTGTSGAETYIVAYSTPTSVTVSTSATVPSQSCVVWYVNTSALTSPISGLTWTAPNGEAFNFSSPVVDGDTCTVTHQTVRISSPFTTARTVTEIGFNYNGTALFDRDVIQPGIGLSVDDQARVTIQLICVHTGLTVVTQANVGTGYSTAGTKWLESLGGTNGAGWAFFTASGSYGGGGAYILEPGSNQPAFGVIMADFSPVPFRVLVMENRANTVHKLATRATYGTGNKYIDTTAKLGISEAVGTIYGLLIGTSATGGQLYCVKLSTPVAKSSLQTLSITFRKSWSRSLSN